MSYLLAIPKARRMKTLSMKIKPIARRLFRYVGLWLLIALMLLACDDVAEVTDVAQATVEPPRPAPTQSVAQSQWQQAFVTYIEESMAEAGIPGLALALVSRDETLLVQGFGLRNVATGAPVTGDTLFHIGSTHKSMTALAVAVLVDEGKLGWDQPVADLSDGFELADPNATRAVTIRHLLNMTAGISEDAEDDLPDEATPEDVFDAAAESELLGMPGALFEYSNVSASLAGYLAVLADGGRFDDLYDGYARLLQRTLLDPIGMTGATIYASEAQASPNHSLSYGINRNGQPVLTPTYDFDGDALAPSGSLKASAAQMALYVRTHLGRGVAPNGRRIVSASNLMETWQPYLENYGMGWERSRYAGIEVIAHEGAYDDFVSVIGFLPEQELGFVILINSEEAGSGLIEEAPRVLAEFLSRESTRPLSLYLPNVHR
jgi:CubicO group peptidase (beta-lactamase class C family)